MAESARTYEALERTTHMLRKKTEHLEAQSTQLEKEVQEHHSARQKLEQTLKELKSVQRRVVQQERLKALGEMVSGIAHDFNNTLTPITAYASLLQFDENLPSQEREEYLGIILTAAQDAANMIHRLRQLYKPSLKSHDQSDFSIDRVVLDAIVLAQPRWTTESTPAGKDITVNQELSNIGTLFGVESDIRQAVLNLILNAVDAIQNHGNITIRTGCDTQNKWISVIDDGGGMTADILDRCREPFFSTKGERGTGLGLPMVIETTMRHGGELQIESAPGLGTTISMILPIEVPTSLLSVSPTDSFEHIVETTAPVSDDENTLLRTRIISSEFKNGSSRMQDENNSDTADTSATRSPTILNILLVDDDEVIRRAFGRHLINAGHRVLIAEDGEQALEFSKTQNFDFVITDVDMPRMRGDDLAVKLRQQHPGLVIVLYTGNPEGVKQAGLDASNDVLQKPTPPAEILNRGLTLLGASQD